MKILVSGKNEIKYKLHMYITHENTEKYVDYDSTWNKFEFRWPKVLYLPISQPCKILVSWPDKQPFRLSNDPSDRLQDNDEIITFGSEKLLLLPFCKKLNCPGYIL